MTQRAFSRARTALPRRTMLDALPLEVWAMTKIWMLLERCFADARLVEDIVWQPGGRRQLAYATHTLRMSLENAWT